MTTRSRRGDMLMQKLADRHVLTPEGAAFLTASLDPFHDSEISNLCGVPDEETGSSVVVRYQKSLVIKAPEALADGDVWNVRIHQYPFLQALDWNLATSRANNVVEAASLNVGHEGGLSVITSVGNDDVPTMVAAGGFHGLEVDSQYLLGATRPIAAGFEVNNVTPELYKGGEVYVYRQNNSYPVSGVWQIGAQGVDAITFAAGSLMRPVPRNPADVMIQPTSLTWEAADGVYSTTTMCDISNPPIVVDYEIPIIPLQDEEYGVINTESVYYPSTTSLGNALLMRVSPTCKIFPMNSNGALFCGLHKATVLNLTWRIYMEVFPNPRSTSPLVPLCEPSAAYDPAALEMLSQAARLLPVGCKVGENPTGEWWQTVLEMVRDWAIPVGAALGMPEIGMGVAGIAGGIQRELKGTPNPSKKAEARVMQKIRTGQPYNKQIKRAPSKAQPQQGGGKAARKRRARQRKRAGLPPVPPR